MKKHIYLLSLLCLTSCSVKQNEIKWIESTPQSAWQESVVNAANEEKSSSVIRIDTTQTEQTIEGFGACFNELGWTSLSELSDKDRNDIMAELFEPNKGANLKICRMPVGANDFSRDWYSYNETKGDFEMKNFSIKNDYETLIPFIKEAMKYRPDLKLWASPWAPPTWMKINNHYAGASTYEKVKKTLAEIERRKSKGENTDDCIIVDNGLDPKDEGYQGLDMFRMQDKYLKAYALYFQKFIEAYRNEGITISAVMPQNEFNSAQIFPSCCWTAAGLARFVGDYLGPAMQEKGVDVLFGTMERAQSSMVDTLLTDEKSSKYIKGVGFQWAGKGAIADVRKQHPGVQLWQTEQECGDGKNTWDGAAYSWGLLKHFLDNGVSVYDYWNISLEEGGISHWGWAQNSLVVVDKKQKSYRYTPEYYVIKHVSHFVKPGAVYLDVCNGQDALAFRNTDGSVVVIMANREDTAKDVTFDFYGTQYTANLKGNSFNTFVF